MVGLVGLVVGDFGCCYMVAFGFSGWFMVGGFGLVGLMLAGGLVV